MFRKCHAATGNVGFLWRARKATDRVLFLPRTSVSYREQVAGNPLAADDELAFTLVGGFLPNSAVHGSATACVKFTAKGTGLERVFLWRASVSYGNVGFQ